MAGGKNLIAGRTHVVGVGVAGMLLGDLVNLVRGYDVDGGSGVSQSKDINYTLNGSINCVGRFAIVQLRHAIHNHSHFAVLKFGVFNSFTERFFEIKGRCRNAIKWIRCRIRRTITKKDGRGGVFRSHFLFMQNNNWRALKRGMHAPRVRHPEQGRN